MIRLVSRFRVTRPARRSPMGLSALLATLLIGHAANAMPNPGAGTSGAGGSGAGPSSAGRPAQVEDLPPFQNGSNLEWKRWATSHRGTAVIGTEPPDVRPPRSFAGERDEQVLRWIATVLKLYLKDLRGLTPTEVQVGIDEHGDLYVSSNNDRANEELRRVFADRTPAQGLDSVLAALRNYWPLHPNNAREAEANRRALRHADKLHTGMRSSRDERVWSALRGRPAQIPPRRTGTVDTHAEIRIRDMIGAGPFRRATVRGTMRPCLECFTEVWRKGDHPRAPRSFGPLWTSRSGTNGQRDPSTFADRYRWVVDRGGRTAKTDGRGAADHTHYDTDSESEPEPLRDLPPDALRPGESFPDWLLRQGYTDPRAHKRPRTADGAGPSRSSPGPSCD